MTEAPHTHAVHADMLCTTLRLPAGAIGIDAGMTLTKIARATGDGIVLDARETITAFGDGWSAMRDAASGNGRAGVTGANVRGVPNPEDHIQVQEIDASARGVLALLETDGRVGDGEFIMVLLGTGTAFAAVRDGKAQHLGGTPLGGGSFTGIARRVDASLTYEQMIAGAARGDRRNVDAMVSDIYPDGIGRISAEMTASHLAKRGDSSLDDFLAGLLNLHGENIAQIAASRAIIAKLPRIVIAGGFAHHNEALIASITNMASLFGTQVETVVAPGYAGAIGAALIAARELK